MPHYYLYQKRANKSGQGTGQQDRSGQERRGQPCWATNSMKEIPLKEQEAAGVGLQQLLEFVFPPKLQHPLSSGRLLAFALYGPLDGRGQLRSGWKGLHVVQDWELDAMCLQFEREDIVQVYISEGRPLCTLSEAQKDEVVAQADVHLKTNKGRGMMKKRQNKKK